MPESLMSATCCLTSIFVKNVYLLDFPYIIHNYEQYFIGFAFVVNVWTIFVNLNFTVGFLSMS